MIKRAKLVRGDTAKLEELTAEFRRAVTGATELHVQVMEGHFKPRRRARIIESNSTQSQEDLACS